MSPNSDNAMARFLFAILKQKSLKDIDWNQVANDPVLLAPITNGHAARMRYSRFRTTVTNTEAQKRGRPGDKGRVSKSSKKDGQQRKGSIVKSESGASLSSYAQLSPASMTSPYLGDLGDEFNTRFMTPCSDDLSAGLCINPASMKSSSHNDALLFPPLDGGSDFVHSHAGHDHVGLAQSPGFSAFDTAFDLNTYKMGSVEGHSQDAMGVSGHQTLADYTHDWSDHI